MSDTTIQIGQLIASARQKRGWTQSALADAVGRVQSTIAMWENGERAVPSPDLVAIATCLGVPASRLLPGLATESMYSPTPWTTGPGGVVYDAVGTDIGMMDSVSDAELVRTAVNAHDPCVGTRWVCEAHGIHPVTGPGACDTTAGKPCTYCVTTRPPASPPGADVVAELQP